jgi:hypothetical protein
MSIFANVKIKNGDAVLALKKNSDQQKLIANVPTMIDALGVLVDRQITNGKTAEMLQSFLAGYNKYGRLRPQMLVTLQDVILQNSDALLRIIVESNSVRETVTVTTPVEREPGDESENDEDDPFNS